MRFLTFLAIGLLLAGCGAAPSAVPADAGKISASQAVKLTNGSFTFTLYSPEDQAVLSQPQVELRGAVSSDAVVTIDEESYVIAAGSFTRTVPLDEGLNTIQIVASDMNGNEVDLILTITYQPS